MLRSTGRACAVLLLALGSTAAWSGIKLPHVVHGSINLKPQNCMCCQGITCWKDRVYVGGLATSGAGPNVWSVDAVDPDSLQYLSSSGVGFKTYGMMARDDKLYAASWFEGLRIYDITTGILDPLGAYDPPEGAFWTLDISNNRVYLTQGTETTSGIHMIDVSNPSNPRLLSAISDDEGIGRVAVRGSYLFFTDAHHSGVPEWNVGRLKVYNISDELNPYLIKQIDRFHPIGDGLLRGDYLYVTWGESGWVNYGGDGLPSTGDYPWAVAEGSESWASSSSGLLRVNDNSTAAGSRVKWSRSWVGNPTNGTTVFARIRCASVGGDTSSLGNIHVEDGTHKERFQLFTDRITAAESGLTYWLNATQWHTYRITTIGSQFRLYVDENSTPVLTGTMTATTTSKRVMFGGGADAATQDIYFDYFNVNGQEALLPNVNGGVEIYDVSDPTNPVLVGQYAGVAGSGLHMLGDYLFYGTSGNGFMTIDVSDPFNPHSVAQTNMTGYELCITGNGRYLYSGNLAGDWEGWVYAVEAFDSDPDKSLPTWSGYLLADASWDTEYLGDALPTLSNPEWALTSGSTEALASVSAGVLRVNDNSGSANCSWVRNWDATNCRGATVLVRARCASYDLNGGSIGNLNNVTIQDGRYEESLTILTDRIRANRAGAEALLDGTQWHTYRITTIGTQFKVYVDEAATPVIASTLSTTTNRARVFFGSTSTLSKQDIYFDSVQCFSNGVYGPAGQTNDLTPDIEVSVSDVVHNDSISGIDPSTAQYYWSTDGGVTWNPSGWDCHYEADALPTASSPVWTVAEGSEIWASVDSGILRMNDTSTASGSKIKWSRAWAANPTTGTTVIACARCASTGGDTTYTCNIFVEDGVRREYFKIMTDRIVAAEAGLTYMLDGTAWHTYRVTTKDSTFKVYVDEAPTPILQGTMGATTTDNRVMFGSGASAGTQDIYFDYVYYTSQGDLAPGQGGGAGQPASCTGLAGDYNATITASAVPFNQYSETLNKIKFSIRDMVGNLAYSPVYNVRIDPNAGPRVTNVTSDKANGSYKAGTLFNIQVSFNTNVTVIGTSRLLLETGTTDRYASYTGGSGTSVLNYAYAAQVNDTSSDLDYISANALSIVSGSIRDSFGSDADLRLATPGGPGSLGYNKNLVVDGVFPRVTNVTSDKADGVYKSGETIDVLLIFNEPVTVTGTPQLELETGAVDRKANYLSGSGSSALTFRYVVQSGDESADLDYKATNSLSLNGGTIRDGVGNVASLILPAPGAAGSLGSNKELVVIVADGRIADARSQGDGVSVTLGDKVLYYRQGSVGYIEESDRTCGIRLEGTISASEGDLVCLRGVMATTTGGERCIQVSLVTPHGIGSVDPIGGSNAGLRSTLLEGMYVVAWGRVMSDPVGNSYIITDGSDLTGITVLTVDAAGLLQGDYVSVWGAAGFDSGRIVYEKTRR